MKKEFQAKIKLTIIDFTSKQKDHVEDLGPYLQSIYSRFMRAEGPLN